jgi:predicted ester cyclase
MTLTTQQMDRAIDEHFGYEAADDIDGVVATLAPDVIHDIVGWPGGPTFGPDNARPFYERLFADLADGQVQCVKRLYGENFLVDESLWRGTAAGRPFGVEGHGRALEFRLLHLIEFTPAGRIGRENVWVDLAAIQQQLAPV